MQQFGKRLAGNGWKPIRIGERATDCNGTRWECVATNDLAVPYWSKVVRGKSQKRQYTIAQFSRNYAVV